MQTLRPDLLVSFPSSVYPRGGFVNFHGAWPRERTFRKGGEEEKVKRAKGIFCSWGNESCTVISALGRVIGKKRMLYEAAFDELASLLASSAEDVPGPQPDIPVAFPIGMKR